MSRGILSRGILSGGFCPGGFCPGGFCPDTSCNIYPVLVIMQLIVLTDWGLLRSACKIEGWDLVDFGQLYLISAASELTVH